MVDCEVKEESLDLGFRVKVKGGKGRWRFLTDMTVQKPHSRIVWLERNSQIASKRQERHVPSWRILEVEILHALVDVVGCGVLSENNKVVAVQVNGMVEWGVDLRGEAG